MVSGMERVNIYGLMDLFMKVNGNKIRLMALAN
jgi:hypothetical protein